MPTETRIVSPGQRYRTVRSAEGVVLDPPADWALLKPGDAAVTRKVKSAGSTWTVQEKKGRRTFSQGIWAPKENIERAKAEVEATREDPAYQKKLAADRQRRADKEEVYKEEFRSEIFKFLNFDDKYKTAAEKLALAVCEHAIPVGSGTVARTKRISIDERASRAVIAWMRHQTSAYDMMPVARVKGARRELRGKIAEVSRKILAKYRRWEGVDEMSCPLYKAIKKLG
ncbi:MAG: DUF2293 domain-containing protein [Lentisphaeraceae bacterium]|nr:DUF2293 domain-containing protein [Lentisphaeraceae bacterium]